MNKVLEGWSFAKVFNEEEKVIENQRLSNGPKLEGYEHYGWDYFFQFCKAGDAEVHNKTKILNTYYTEYNQKWAALSLEQKQQWIRLAWYMEGYGVYGRDTFGMQLAFDGE